MKSGSKNGSSVTTKGEVSDRIYKFQRGRNQNIWPLLGSQPNLGNPGTVYICNTIWIMKTLKEINILQWRRKELVLYKDFDTLILKIEMKKIFFKF